MYKFLKLYNPLTIGNEPEPDPGNIYLLRVCKMMRLLNTEHWVLPNKHPESQGYSYIIGEWLS
jgi:hypothetical protein